MDIYNGIVVGNSGLEGEIEVYIPSLMSRMEPDTLDTSTKNSSSFKSRVSDASGAASKMESSFNLSNTMTAKPLFMNSNSKEGSYLVPIVGSLVSTLFLNGDQTECYYMFDSAADQKNKTYILDFESLINSPNGADPTTKPNIKVLLRTLNNSIIAFDTNPDKNSFIMRVNGGHFIEVQDGEVSGINMTTKDGCIFNMDNPTGHISLTNGTDKVDLTNGTITATNGTDNLELLNGTVNLNNGSATIVLAGGNILLN